MDSVKPQMPNISNEDRTPLVDVLLDEAAIAAETKSLYV